jgi:hypothetical protein
VLAVLGPQGGNAGLIHLEARTTAQEITDLFALWAEHPSVSSAQTS